MRSHLFALPLVFLAASMCARSEDSQASLASEIRSFDDAAVRESIVPIRVPSPLSTKDRRYLGVVVAPGVLLVGGDLVESLGNRTSIEIEGQAVTVAKVSEDGDLALLNLPSEKYQSATIALSPVPKGRSVFVSSWGDSGEIGSVGGSALNQTSANARLTGYFDLSVDSDAIGLRGAPVFNNCGELTGYFSQGAGRGVSSAKLLESIKAIAAGVGELAVSGSACLSEQDQAALAVLEAAGEANDARDQAAAAQSRVQEIEATVEESEERLSEAQEELEAARKELEQAQLAASEAGEEVSEVRQEALARQEEAERALAEAQAAAGAAQIEAEEASAALKEQLEAANAAIEEEREKAAAERAKAAEERLRLRIIFGAFLGILLLAFIIWRVRSRKSGEESEVTLEPSAPFDMILRGASISLKIPGDVLGRTGGAVMGRSAMDCDYVVDAPEVSRRHAGVSFTDGMLLVRDLGSANGTFVNGRQLEVDSPAALHEGDSLRLAGVDFTVELRSA